MIDVTMNCFGQIVEGKDVKVPIFKSAELATQNKQKEQYKRVIDIITDVEIYIHKKCKRFLLRL